MRCLITGAGGFIGGHLTKRLVEENHEVRAVDIKPLDEWWQVSSVAQNWGNCDLRLRDNCYEATCGIDRVYNLAADMGGIGFIEHNKAACMESVLINTHLLKASVGNKVQRYFYSSSACVYAAGKQDQPDMPALKEEDAYPAMPEDGYGWEKLFSERMCRHFMEDYGLETRVARFHNSYGHCFDEHTEILTDRGWKFFCDLTDERVATLSPDGSVEYWRPDAYQAYPYSGAMHTCESIRVNFNVTPDHALYASSRTTKNGKTVSTDFRRVTAKSSLWNNARLDFTCHMNWPEDDDIERTYTFPEEYMKDGRSMRAKGGGQKVVPLLDWLEFAGYFIADGSSWITPSNHTVAITKYRSDKAALKEQIMDVVRRMGFHFSRSSDDHHIIVSSKQLWRAVQSLGVGANNKTFPREWLDLPRKYLRRLFDALMSCDGDTDGGRYSTSSMDLANLFMELAMKLGKRAFLTRDHVWRIHLSNNTRLGTRRKDRVLTEYSGMVYDVTVRNHVIMVRRGGKAHWSGNCGSWEGGREKAPAAICRKIAEAKLTGNHVIDVWGDGTRTRSFMWIGDNIDGILKIMDSDIRHPINLGSSECVTINQLIDTVADIAGITVEKQCDMTKPQGVYGRNSDNTLIKQLLDWEPSTPLRTGLEQTYHWIEEQVRKTTDAP
jgi:nucleoside-diphosphate-sugar epimerase